MNAFMNSSLIVDLLHEGGFKRMHDFISDTASYGDLSRGSQSVTLMSVNR